MKKFIFSYLILVCSLVITSRLTAQCEGINFSYNYSCVEDVNSVYFPLIELHVYGLNGNYGITLQSELSATTIEIDGIIVDDINQFSINQDQILRIEGEINNLDLEQFIVQINSPDCSMPITFTTTKLDCDPTTFYNGNHYFVDDVNNRFFDKEKIDNSLVHIKSVGMFGYENESGKDKYGYTNYGNFNLINNIPDDDSLGETFPITIASELDHVDIKLLIFFDFNHDYIFQESEIYSSLPFTINGGEQTLVMAYDVGFDFDLIGADDFILMRVIVKITDSNNESPVVGGMDNMLISGEIEDYYLRPFEHTELVIDNDWYTGGNLKIRDNDVFKIENSNVYFMNEESEILVKEGGELQVRHSNLNAHDKFILDEGEFEQNFSHWNGIRVEGNSNIAHPNITDLPIDEVLNPNHGILYAKNSTIKHAKIAVSDNNEDNLGGGIVLLEDCNFTNNITGCEFHHFIEGETNDTRFINSCIFTNSELLWDDENADIRQVNLVGAKAIPINNCTFNKTNGANEEILEDEWVTGIYCLNGQAYINESDDAPNTFNNLDVGVEIRDILGLGGHALYNNTFNNVKQGVNATASTAISLIRNEFLDIPEGEVITWGDGVVDWEDVAENWGIFIDDCLDLEIRSNLFETSASAYEPIGMIIKDSRPIENSITESNVVRGNMIRGSFAIGSVYQGDNSELDIDCNHYRDNEATPAIDAPENDWGLAVNDNGVFFLNEQGVCIFPFDDPFKNEWHNEAAGGLHIASFNAFFASTPDYSKSLALNADVNSTPTLIEGSINLEFDTCAEDNPCMNEEDWGKTVEDENPDDCELSFSDIIRELRSGNSQQLRDRLECLDTDWANSLLTATYIGDRNLTKANERLDRISNNDNYGQVRLAYQNMIDAISNSTGKNNPALHNLNEQASVVSQSLFQNLSRTAVEMNGGKSFKKQLHIKIPQEESALNTSQTLILSPNPTSNYIDLELVNGVSSTLNGFNYNIYDLTGRLVQKGKANERLNIVDLQIGTYIIQLSDNESNFKTGKFIVQR